MRSETAAVVFDLDGVLLDSEGTWARARRDVAQEAGRPWPPGADQAMIGMSSPEWAAYMHDEIAVDDDPKTIIDAVVERVLETYDERLPLLPGAAEAVRRLAARWPLGLASSSNRPVIDAVLEASGLGTSFAVTVSSEEVARGKPAPDVYLAAAVGLGVDAVRCAAVEDSTNGIRSAVAAGMAVIAVPNRQFPPDADVMALVATVLDDLDALTPEVVDGLRRREQRRQ